jgi:tetratricopeptide (TPR) repeat protein
MFEKYSERAKQAIHYAKCNASRTGSVEVRTEDILLGVLRDEAFADKALGNVTAQEIREDILTQQSPQEELAAPGDLPLSVGSRQALFYANEEAERTGYRTVTPGHILLGLLQTEDSYAARVLKRKQFSTAQLRSLLAESERWQSDSGVSKSPSVRDDRAGGPEAMVVELATEGKSREALKVVDDALADAKQDRKLLVRSLCPVAIVLANEIGDLRRAKHYSEELLADDPNNALALYYLASALALEGRRAEARTYAARSYELSVALNDAQGRGLVELIENRFPEIKAGSK